MHRIVIGAAISKLGHESDLSPLCHTLRWSHLECFIQIIQKFWHKSKASVDPLAFQELPHSLRLQQE